jgi:NitT/TauT family transport system substrate-binding protein
MFILALIAILLSACVGAQPVATVKQPLRVAWSLWPGYYPMAIAVEKGFFTKHGVQVEPVFYEVTSNQNPDLAAGMLDGAGIVLGDVLLDSLSSTNKVVLVLDSSTGGDSIVASADIKSPQDLRGKRIGVKLSTFGELLVRDMLEKNDISLNDVTLVDISPEALPAALPRLVDAGHTFDPFTTRATSSGNNIIYSSADAPGLIVDVMAFNRKVIKERPEDVKAFVAAWLEAIQYWKDNPADGNAIIAKATGQKAEAISTEGITLFDQAANFKAFTKGTDNSSLYFTAEEELKFFIEISLVTYPVKVDDFLDPSFLK